MTNTIFRVILRILVTCRAYCAKSSKSSETIIISSITIITCSRGYWGGGGSRGAAPKTIGRLRIVTCLAVIRCLGIVRGLRIVGCLRICVGGNAKVDNFRGRDRKTKRNTHKNGSCVMVCSRDSKNYFVGATSNTSRIISRCICCEPCN